MILQGDKDQTPRNHGPGGATLDELFRRAGVQSSTAVALIDPPNRETFTDGAPRRLTYAQADRAIAALSAKLCRLGLQADTVVAIQLPNTVEMIITLLAVLRAGMIAAPMPLLWRQHDLKAALSSVGAKAIVTMAHVGAIEHASIAMQVAGDLFRFALSVALAPTCPMASCRSTMFSSPRNRRACSALSAPATPPIMSRSSPSMSRRTDWSPPRAAIAS